MTKQQTIQKTKELFIAKDPRLSDPEYRKKMSPEKKSMLVAEMVLIAKKIELFNK